MEKKSRREHGKGKLKVYSKRDYAYRNPFFISSRRKHMNVKKIEKDYEYNYLAGQWEGEIRTSDRELFFEDDHLKGLLKKMDQAIKILS